MPHEVLDIAQVARYLDLDEREVNKLASRGKIPCQRRGQSFVFYKADVDHWVELQLHEMPHHRLAGIEAGVSTHHGLSCSDMLVCSVIPPAGISIPLPSRTGKSVLRDLVNIADQSNLVYDRDELLAAIEAREILCSTAILPHTALPHARTPLPYDIADSFVIVGRSDAGIPFNAADGSLTRLFFLICCKDERTHLHILARLGRMLQFRNAIHMLLEAPDAGVFLEILADLERQAMSGSSR